MIRRTAALVPAALLLAALVTSARCATTSTASPVVAATGPGAWFVNTGCTGCHPVSVYGLQNPAATGPDLSIAVADVQKRFGRPLEEFLRTPVGTMSIVLSTRIPLTDEDKRAALEELRAAYALYLQRGGPKPVSSH